MNIHSKQWDREIEEVTNQLIEGGVPPFRAMEKAQNIVSNRRRSAINLDELPEDVRDAIFSK